ncbi:MAG: TonB-dependent receptor [Thermoanaerobaculia bacterium]
MERPQPTSPTRQLLRSRRPPAVSAVALFLFAAAASAFEGRVVLPSGAPVAGAEVSILGLNGAERTDSDGRFTWRPSPPPPFEVLVVLPGGRYMKPIRIETLPETGPVAIEVMPLAEESVTVTAGAAPTLEASPANGTTIVPRPDIEARQPFNLTQSLEDVAGVSSVSEGQAAVPAVRGLARGRTLILIDGARVTSERRVGPSATYLDPFVLDAVEVSRGPGFVAYGSDAFGGVISARTRGVAPGQPLRVLATGGVGVGIPGGRAGLSISGPLGTEGGFLVLGHYRDDGDYESPDGEVINSGFQDSGVLLRAAHRLGPGMLTAAWAGDYARDIGRPRNNSQTARFYYPEEDSSRFTLSYDLDPALGFSRMSLTAFLGSYSLVTDQDTFATSSRPRSIERADVSADDYQVRAFAERFLGPARLEFGVDVNGRYNLHALDISLVYDQDPPRERVNVSVDDARRNDTGVYASLDAPIFPKLAVAGGIRGDWVSTTNEGGYFGDHSTSNAAPSGFASLTAGSFGGFSATAQFSSGFRDPVLSDRYFRGPSGRGFITGNPNLQAERSYQYDLALRFIGPWYRTAFYAYQYDIQNLIERYTGENPDDFFFRNRGEARLRGLELEAQADVGAGFSLALAAQIERGETLDDHRPIDDVPPGSVSLQVRKTFGRGFALLRGAAYDDDPLPGPNERARPGYGIIDLGGGFNFTPWLELRAYVRNLLDKRYPVSPDSRAVEAPGISAMFTLDVRL